MTRKSLDRVYSTTHRVLLSLTHTGTGVTILFDNQPLPPWFKSALAFGDIAAESIIFWTIMKTRQLFHGMKSAFVRTQTIPRPRIQTFLWNLDLWLDNKFLDLKNMKYYLRLFKIVPMISGLMHRQRVSRPERFLTQWAVEA